MMRTVLIGGFAFVLAACGDAPDFKQMKQGAADLGGQALEAASGAVDTRTACMLAGQSEVFCGCVQDRLGSKMTGEHLTTLKKVVGESLDTLDGYSLAEAPVPAPRPGQVRLRITDCGLGYVDALVALSGQGMGKTLVGAGA
jgi:hypothetical protein